MKDGEKVPPLIYKQRDPVPNWTNTRAQNFHHVKYIATRPRVLKNEGLNHGLFGNIQNGSAEKLDSVPDAQRCVLKASREKKNIHRGVISFTPEAAKQLGLTKITDWQALVRQQVHILAGHNDIAVENLRWIAAAHMEKTHPHVHVMFWDDAQTMPISMVSPQIPNKIRTDLIRSLFEEELKVFCEERKLQLRRVKELADNVVSDWEKSLEALSPGAFAYMAHPEVENASKRKNTYTFPLPYRP